MCRMRDTGWAMLKRGQVGPHPCPDLEMQSLDPHHSQDAPGWALCWGLPEVAESLRTLKPSDVAGLEMGRPSDSHIQPLNLGQWAGEHQGTSPLGAQGHPLLSL